MTLEKIKIERLSKSERSRIAYDLKHFVSTLTGLGIKGDIRYDNFIWNGVTLRGLDFDVDPFDLEKWVVTENNGGLQKMLSDLGIGGA